MKKINSLLVIGYIFTVMGLGVALSNPDNKKVTIINTQGEPPRAQPITTRLLEDCIISLPTPNEVMADVQSSTEYLKGIMGEDGKNAFTKVYRATIEIPYLSKQKELIIVPVPSIEGMAPKMETFTKKLPSKEVFASRSENGDLFAGRSNRQYYFSSAEAAINDVKKQAQVWIQQHSHLLCKE